MIFNQSERVHFPVYVLIYNIHALSVCYKYKPSKGPVIIYWGVRPLSFEEVGSKIVTLPQVGVQKNVTLPRLESKTLTLLFERTHKKWNTVP